MADPVTIALIGLVSTAAMMWNFGDFGGDQKSDKNGVGITIDYPLEGTKFPDDEQFWISWKHHDPKIMIERVAIILAPASELGRLGRGKRIKDFEPFDYAPRHTLSKFYDVPRDYDKKGYMALLLALGRGGRVLAESQPVHYSFRKKRGESVAPPGQTAIARKETCGKAFATYNFGGKNDMTDQEIIERVLPWTVLIDNVQQSWVRHSVGVMFEENTFAYSTRGVAIPKITKENYHIKVFPAKDIIDKELKGAGLHGPGRIALITDSSPERQKFGAVFHFKGAVTKQQSIQPICRPKKDVDKQSQCLVVGWQVDYEVGTGRRTFDPKVLEAKITSDESCKFAWNDVAEGDGICVQFDKEPRPNLDTFAYGPLVCYDKEEDIWSLQGLAKITYIQIRPLLFASFFKHEKNNRVQEAIDDAKSS